MATHRTDLTASERQALYDVVLDQLARADQTLNESDTDLIVHDLTALACDEPEWNDEPFEDVYAEWIRRIGGYGNLITYIRCLQVGQARRIRASEGD